METLSPFTLGQGQAIFEARDSPVAARRPDSTEPAGAFEARFWPRSCGAVAEQVEGEACESGQLADVNGVDPGGERGTEAVGEDLTEVGDLLGGGVQFGTARQDVLQGGAFLLAEGRGEAGESAGDLPHRRWWERRAGWRCRRGPGMPRSGRAVPLVISDSSWSAASRNWPHSTVPSRSVPPMACPADHERRR
jgi:hypothetical protein